MPLYFGITLTGWMGTLYMAVFCAIQIYVALGLFKLGKEGWIWAVSLNFYYMLTIIAQSLTLTQEQFDLLNSQFQGSYQGHSLTQFKWLTLPGLIFPVAVLIYLFVKKKIFFEKDK